MPLQVFVAHTGKTLELECAPNTKVEDVQETLATLTGIDPPNLILTCNGSPLLPSHLLHSYTIGISSDDTSHTSHHIFLYDKTLLRPDAPMPLQEVQRLPPALPQQLIMPPHETSSSSSLQQHQEHHPLDDATSPLLRSLPQYYRQFMNNVDRAQRTAEAGALRVELCCRLINEAEVQAMAVDAAMASVEPHYIFICNVQAAFADEFAKKYYAHEDILSTFETDIKFLSTIELPKQLQTAGCGMKLSDLVDIDELRASASECARSHRHFASRVSEVNALHAALCSDVESLFMRTPSIDIDALSLGLDKARSLAEEQSTAVQALRADLKKVKDALDTGSNCAASEVPPLLKDSIGKQLIINSFRGSLTIGP